MFQTADELLTAYERGRVTRRALLTVLVGMVGLGGASLSAQQRPPGIRLDHINLKVSNLERSIAFYEKVFGPEYRREGRIPTNQPYDLGTGPFAPWISLQDDAMVRQEGRLQYTPIWHQSLYTKPGVWEHIAIEVENYDQVVAAVETAGVEVSAGENYTWTHDPDGALIQIRNARVPSR